MGPECHNTECKYIMDFIELRIEELCLYVHLSKMGYCLFKPVFRSRDCEKYVCINIKEFYVDEFFERSLTRVGQNVCCRF